MAREATITREVDGTPPVVAHTDWSARNVRLGERGLVAVYDWDSVALISEATALGHAAMTWSVTAEPGGSVFPTLGEVVAYMQHYEAARGEPLSPTQWRSAGGAAAWVLAYTARCEHSLAVLGRTRPDQHGARQRLADVGRALLELERR
jgi:aminoglycoside phosphotransferase (APT) family kinase protein